MYSSAALNLLGCCVGVQFMCEICQASFFQSCCQCCCTASHSSICGNHTGQKERKTPNKPQTKSQDPHPWKRMAEALSAVSISVEQLIFILGQYYGNGKSCQLFLSTADKSCLENLFQDNSVGLVHLAGAEFCRSRTVL